MVSRGGKWTGFSVHIFLNCNRNSRSYLGMDFGEYEREREIAGSPELALLSIPVQLGFRTVDAFGVRDSQDFQYSEQ